MNVVIVGAFWYPTGTASAARVRNLAQGLLECGAAVHVIATVPQPRGGARAGREQDGVTFEYAAPLQAASDGWRDAERTVPRLRQGPLATARWFAGLYGATPRACRSLRERIDAGACDLLLVYERSYLRMAPLARLARSRGVPVVLDVVEASEHLRRRRASPLYWDFVAGARATPRLFDGVSAITTGLAALYRSRGCAQTLVVPSIEQWTAAMPPPAVGAGRFRLTYVGALQERDAPDLLLAAMKALHRRGADVSLDVVGHYDGTARGAAARARCAADHDLGAVRFLGSLSEAALVAHLAASDGIVLTRRAARPEELAVPTRLVEHLRHGRPVFVSDVGDVARYLVHGRDAVLLDPRDAERAAEAVAEVAGRADRGAPIGLAGRVAGARAFDRRVHAARLLEFASLLRTGRAA
ncbi:MAG: glycosyltransferase [Vicinamibacteria bacterium]